MRSVQAALETEAQLAVLVEEKAKLEMMADEALKELEKALDRASAVENEATQLKTVCEFTQQELCALAEAHGKLEAALQQRELQASELEAALGEATQRGTELESRLNARVEELEHSLAEQQGLVDSARIEVEVAHKRAESLQAELDSTGDTLQGLRQELAQAQAEIVTKDAELQAIEASLLRSGSELHDIIQSKSAELSVLKERQAELAEDLAAAEGRAATAESRVLEAGAHKLAAEAQFAVLQKKTDEALAEADTAHRVKEAIVEGLKEQLRGARAERDYVQQQRERSEELARTRIEQLEEKQTDHARRFDECKQKLERATADRTALAEAHKALEQVLFESQAESTRLDGALQAVTGDLRRAEQQLAAARAEVAEIATPNAAESVTVMQLDAALKKNEVLAFPLDFCHCSISSVTCLAGLSGMVVPAWPAGTQHTTQRTRCRDRAPAGAAARARGVA